MIRFKCSQWYSKYGIYGICAYNPRDHGARSWNAADNSLSNLVHLFISFFTFRISVSELWHTCLTHSALSTSYHIVYDSCCCCCNCCGCREAIRKTEFGVCQEFYFNRALKINICVPDSTTCHRSSSSSIISCSVSFNFKMNRCI